MRLIDADALNVRSYCRWFDDPDDVRVVERMIREAPTITPPPNDPLTLEELREMDGEPVWVEFIPSPREEPTGFWALISADKEDGEIFLLNSPGGSSGYEEAWADIRAIYRRKPEEGSE